VEPPLVDETAIEGPFYQDFRFAQTEHFQQDLEWGIQATGRTPPSGR
jgi:hypothetical protein